MSKFKDREKYFQTDDAINEEDRRAAKAQNKHGQPIRLPSKINAIIVDGESIDSVYAAESSGTARKVDLVTGKISHTFTGPTAPLTCLALSTPSAPSQTSTLYAGCWDHSIWSWNTSTRARSRIFSNGHRDFVKCLLWASITSSTSSSTTTSSNNLNLLISGSADTTVIIWDATSGSRLHVLQGHSMGVLSLALDPASLYPPDSASSDGPTTAAPPTPSLFSSSSSPSILRWSLIPTPTNPLSKLLAAPSPDALPLTPHTSTIYSLLFAPPTSSNDYAPDLYTCSADGTVACLSRDENWEVTDRFTPTNTTTTNSNNRKPSTINKTGSSSSSSSNTSHIRALALSADSTLLAFGGRTEDIHIYNTSTGLQLAQLYGHYDEITSLLFLPGPGGGGGGGGPNSNPANAGKLISASLDATIRTWGLASLLPSSPSPSTEEGGGEKDMAGQLYDRSNLFQGGGSSEQTEEGAALGGVGGGEMGLVGGLSGEGIELSPDEAAEIGALMAEEGGDPFD